MEMQLHGNCVQNYTVTMSGRISSVRRGIICNGRDYRAWHRQLV